jgi:hypothetical protein
LSSRQGGKQKSVPGTGRFFVALTRDLFLKSMQGKKIALVTIEIRQIPDVFIAWEKSIASRRRN